MSDSKMREFGLLHETNHSLPIPRLESSLFDEYEFSLPLKSNVVDDAPLIDLEKVFDPPLTSLSFIAPSFSSTPMDTSVSDLTLFASPLTLAQCTGLEMDETFRSDVSIIENYLFHWSKEISLVETYC